MPFGQSPQVYDVGSFAKTDLLLDLTSRIAMVAGAMDEGARQAMKEWAHNVALPEIRRRAPHDTYRLRDSYTAEESSSNLLNQYNLRIGTTVPYAGYQEWGTTRNAAHPHFRPGIQAALPQLPGAILRKVSALDAEIVAGLRVRYFEVLG